MNVFLFLCLSFNYFKNHECGLASEKCEEYGKAVYSETDSPTLTRKVKQDVVADCAIVSVPLIIGGTLATEMEFPHMASLGFGKSPDAELSWDCGGTLISELYILTAAHCMESRELGPAQKVRLGTISFDSPDSSMEERLIAKRIPHPDYKTPSKANDIALVKMDSPITFTPYIRPACLNTEEVGPNTKAVAIGFGKLSFEATTGSEKLMKVTLETYPSEKCSKALTMNDKVIDSMLCAGHTEGGKDTCQGDSGGPLQVVLEKPFCMYKIIGVTSFGKFCGFANSPAIYSKVSSYIPWIENIVWA